MAGDAHRLEVRARHRRHGDRRHWRRLARTVLHLDRATSCGAATLDRDEVLAFAQADAFAAWAPDRRHAAWEGLHASGDVLPLAPATATHHDPVPITHDELVIPRLSRGGNEHRRPSDGVGARAARARRRDRLARVS